MVNYKISYFPLRGYAEPARIILYGAGVEFEDDRIPRDQWGPEQKAKTPFGQIPVLTEDGKQLAQSGAITRYLARKFGFGGRDEWETAQIDALAEQWRDFIVQVRPWFVVKGGFVEGGDLDKLWKDHAVPARELFFKILEKQLSSNGSGWLVGDQLSYVDIIVAEHLYTYKGLEADWTKGHEALDALLNKVHNHPKLKGWFDKREHTIF